MWSYYVLTVVLASEKKATRCPRALPRQNSSLGFHKETGSRREAAASGLPPHAQQSRTTLFTTLSMRQQLRPPFRWPQFSHARCCASSQHVHCWIHVWRDHVSREHSTAAVGFHFGHRPHKRNYCFVLTSLVLCGLQSGVALPTGGRADPAIGNEALAGTRYIRMWYIIRTPH